MAENKNEPCDFNFDEKEMVWVGSSVPFRDTQATYSTWRYTGQPPPPLNDKYRNFQTIDDLEEELKLNGYDDTILPTSSPTSCYFDISREEEIFYRDQQDCVIWCLDKETGGVYLNRSKDEDKKRYVAKTLAEFLWRINVENQCWYKYRGFNGGLDEKKLVKGEIDWNPVEEYELYVDWFLKLYNKTKEYLITHDHGCTRENIDSYLVYYFYPTIDDNDEELLRNAGLRVELLKYFDKLEEDGELKISVGLFSGPELSKECEQKLIEMVKKDNVKI